MAAQLIRVDRNGTKYFVDHACPKCGGRGYINGYEYIEGGICFLCGGSGIHSHGWKEYTPEYEAKLIAKRLAKRKAKSAETNATFCRHYGLAENGDCWLVGGNTYEIKEQLKSAGAKWNELIGWHFDHDVTGFNTMLITWQEMLDAHDVAYIDEDTDEMNFYNCIAFIADWFNMKRNEITARVNKENSKSAYVGEVGKKIETVLKYCGSSVFTSHFTYYGETNYIHKFEDENGNVYIWKTSSPLMAEDEMVSDGSNVKIKGTIKEHREYKGIEQTVLTRCKYSA